MQKMLKKTLVVLTAFVLLLLIAPANKLAYALSKENAVIVMTGEIDGDYVDVDVKLIKNDGIASMRLELVYEEDVFTLINVTRGSALPTLEFVPTNDYSLKPFQIVYEQGANDFTGGLLFTLRFKVNQNAKNGDHKISLSYARNKDVNFYDDDLELKTRNLSIDSVKITTQGSLATQVVTVKASSKTSFFTNIFFIIGTCVFAVSLTILIVYFVKRNKRHWKKI